MIMINTLPFPSSRARDVARESDGSRIGAFSGCVRQLEQFDKRIALYDSAGDSVNVGRCGAA